MIVGVVGSRTLSVRNLGQYLPPETTGLVSGGARGVDTSAEAYARAVGLPFRAFLPDYDRYGKRAPLIRNESIVRASELVLAFWDGESHGTLDSVNHCRRLGVPVRVYLPTGLDSY